MSESSSILPIPGGEGGDVPVIAAPSPLKRARDEEEVKDEDEKASKRIKVENPVAPTPPTNPDGDVWIIITPKMSARDTVQNAVQTQLERRRRKVPEPSGDAGAAFVPQTAMDRLASELASGAVDDDEEEEEESSSSSSNSDADDEDVPEPASNEGNDDSSSGDEEEEGEAKQKETKEDEESGRAELPDDVEMKDAEESSASSSSGSGSGSGEEEEESSNEQEEEEEEEEQGGDEKSQQDDGVDMVVANRIVTVYLSTSGTPEIRAKVEAMLEAVLESEGPVDSTIYRKAMTMLQQGVPEGASEADDPYKLAGIPRDQLPRVENEVETHGAKGGWKRPYRITRFLPDK